MIWNAKEQRENQTNGGGDSPYTAPGASPQGMFQPGGLEPASYPAPEQGRTGADQAPFAQVPQGSYTLPGQEMPPANAAGPAGSWPLLPAGRNGGGFGGDGPGNNGGEKKKKKRTRPIELAILAAALAFLFFSVLCLASLISLNGTLRSWVTPGQRGNTPPSNSFAVIQVVGDIQSAGSDPFGINNPSYHHLATVNYVKQLAEDDDNKGILLYMNTGGGGVYESDELYNALMTYKEVTSRPVWAFMGNACASGGYYICMAADFLVATPNTTTGSIGVYIAFTDTSGLYEKLGIQTVLVKSGENKAVGVPGIEVTEAQRQVYQSSVDEKYERFVELVVEGRDMDEKTARKLADGRAYTGNQAYENGLVDALSDWDTTLALFSEETGAQASYPNFSNTTALGSLISAVRSALPKGEAEAALEAAGQIPNGVPMYYVPGLV